MDARSYACSRIRAIARADSIQRETGAGKAEGAFCSAKPFRCFGTIRVLVAGRTTGHRDGESARLYRNKNILTSARRG
jgi:hypothetical protein